MNAQAAYTTSVKRTLMQFGVADKCAEDVSQALVSLEKKAEFDPASYFTDDYGNIRWSSILVPLALAMGTGFLGYRSGINGRTSRSAWSNIKNYSIGSLRNLVRDNSSYPMYDRDLHHEISGSSKNHIL